MWKRAESAFLVYESAFQGCYERKFGPFVLARRLAVFKHSDMFHHIAVNRLPSQEDTDIARNSQGPPIASQQACEVFYLFSNKLLYRVEFWMLVSENHLYFAIKHSLNSGVQRK